MYLCWDFLKSILFVNAWVNWSWIGNDMAWSVSALLFYPLHCFLSCCPLCCHPCSLTQIDPETAQLTMEFAPCKNGSQSTPVTNNDFPKWTYQLKIDDSWKTTTIFEESVYVGPMLVPQDKQQTTKYTSKWYLWLPQAINSSNVALGHNLKFIIFQPIIQDSRSTPQGSKQPLGLLVCLWHCARCWKIAVSKALLMSLRHPALSSLVRVFESTCCNTLDPCVGCRAPWLHRIGGVHLWVCWFDPPLCWLQYIRHH